MVFASKHHHHHERLSFSRLSQLPAAHQRRIYNFPFFSIALAQKVIITSRQIFSYGPNKHAAIIPHSVLCVCVCVCALAFFALLWLLPVSATTAADTFESSAKSQMKNCLCPFSARNRTESLYFIYMRAYTRRLSNNISAPVCMQPFLSEMHPLADAGRSGAHTQRQEQRTRALSTFC